MEHLCYFALTGCLVLRLLNPHGKPRANHECHTYSYRQAMDGHLELEGRLGNCRTCHGRGVGAANARGRRHGGDVEDSTGDLLAHGCKSS
jgi:hypothetical protein